MLNINFLCYLKMIAFGFSVISESFSLIFVGALWFWNSDAPTHKAMTETQNSDGDPGKAQLLEALCHSQTRAREAEKAAKQAYAEKEHILKLFFRQASHLFAYKQWFKLLQLENLYFQIKNNNGQQISTQLPVMLPWMPHKNRKLQKGPQKPPKGKRRKRGRPRRDISKFAVAFALGLGLVGAGLLLGWTVGWLLPALWDVCVVYADLLPCKKISYQLCCLFVFL